MAFYIRKRSGEKELFDPKKLERSLKKVGAPESVITQILKEVEENSELRTTKKIYAFAYDYLGQTRPAFAARYSLRRALMDLGPAGFPFEQFIAHLFHKQGYKVETNQVISGYCVDHEIDVISSMDSERYMIECKFHKRQNLKCDVKVSLYVKARFDDLQEAWEKHHAEKFTQAWIVTNTKFTSEAVKFAECRNIRLLGWDYPRDNALPDLVAKYELHPITALTSLDANQKKELIQNNFVLCQDASKEKNVLKKLGFSQEEINNVLKEAYEVCKL